MWVDSVVVAVVELVWLLSFMGVQPWYIPESIIPQLISQLFLILSLIAEVGGGAGWTLYPPLI